MRFLPRLEHKNIHVYDNVLYCFLLQVYKVLFAYSPQKDDELELLEGDYVFVSASDQGQTGTEREREGGGRERKKGERERERKGERGREGGREGGGGKRRGRLRGRGSERTLEYMYSHACVNSYGFVHPHIRVCGFNLWLIS